MTTHPNAVTIGSFVSDRDVVGDYRLTTNVEGWGSPPIRLNVDALTGRHGGWVTRGLYAHRTIVHSGFIERDTSTAANAVANEITDLGASDPVAYVVDHEALGPIAVDVVVAVGAEPEWIDDRSFTYTLTLVAPDPFKRSTTGTTTTVAAGATVTPTSSGTAAADLVATTTSSGTVILTAGGVTLTTTSVPSGTVIDTAARTVTGPAGEDLYSAVAPGSQWPALPPGGSLANGGTAGLSVTFFDTYA